MESHTLDRRRLAAIFQGLLVAFLWATSWVLIKFGLIEIPPLVFAGIRYFLAFLILLLVYLVQARRSPMPPIPRRMWGRLVFYGLLMHAVAQGAMFVALVFLPAITLNLLMNFTSLGVALLSVAWLSEKPSWLQWIGIALTLLGVLVYFGPEAIPQAQVWGLLAALVCVLANVIATIIGRDINSARTYPPLQLTTISMGIGSTLLLLAGLLIEGVPSVSLRNWVFIVWLAVVNTAFAYTLWNKTLRTLTAVESSVITGTMLVWIPILAVIFLGEHITPLEILALVAVGVGTLLVQVRTRSPARTS